MKVAPPARRHKRQNLFQTLPGNELLRLKQREHGQHGAHTHHVELVPYLGPLPQSGPQLLHQRQVCWDDDFLLPATQTGAVSLPFPAQWASAVGVLQRDRTRFPPPSPPSGGCKKPERCPKTRAD